MKARQKNRRELLNSGVKISQVSFDNLTQWRERTEQRARVAAYVGGTLAATRFDVATDAPEPGIYAEAIRALANVVRPTQQGGSNCKPLVSILLDRRASDRLRIFQLALAVEAVGSERHDPKAADFDAEELHTTAAGRIALAAFGKPCGPYRFMPRRERAAFAVGAICRARLDVS